MEKREEGLTNKKRKSPQDFKQPSPKKQKLLDEDVYMNAMGTIIARDFFPEVAVVNSEDCSRIIINSRSNSIASSPVAQGLNTSFSEFNRTINSPNRTPSSATATSPQQASSKLKLNLSLDNFLQTHISEDDASFDLIIQKENELKREKYKHFYPEEATSQTNTTSSTTSIRKFLSSPSSPLALPPTHSFLNNFMFTPSLNLEPSRTERQNQTFLTSSKQIIHKNTRISDDILAKNNPKPSFANLSNFSSVTSTPRIHGYSLINTPTSTSAKETPLMTWGQIQNEVSQINVEQEAEAEEARLLWEQSQEKRWKLPEVNQRKEMGRELADKAKKSMKAKTDKLKGITRKERTSAQEKLKRTLEKGRTKGDLGINAELREKYGNVMLTPRRKPVSASSTPVNMPGLISRRVTPIGTPKDVVIDINSPMN